MSELKTKTVLQSPESPVTIELERMRNNLSSLEDYAEKLKARLEPILLVPPAIPNPANGVAEVRPEMCQLVYSLDYANDQMFRIRLKLAAIMDSIQL